MTNVRFFAEWDWELDRGRTQLDPKSLPPSHAVALYDWEDRLYRVSVTRDPRIRPVPDAPSAEEGVVVYDYFSDPSGRVLEKRSLDEKGNVALIVRYQRDERTNEIIETAWSPEQVTAPAARCRRTSLGDA